MTEKEHNERTDTLVKLYQLAETKNRLSQLEIERLQKENERLLAIINLYKKKDDVYENLTKLQKLQSIFRRGNGSSYAVSRTM